MKQIAVNQGERTYWADVDDEDYDFLCNFPGAPVSGGQ
jgi:hypothetical protein